MSNETGPANDNKNGGFLRRIHTADIIAIILSITVAVILIGMSVAPQIRQEVLPDPTISLLEKNLTTIIGGLLLFLGNKMKNGKG